MTVCAPQLPVASPTSDEDKAADELGAVAYFRLEGLKHHLEMAFEEAFKAQQDLDEEDFTAADLKRFRAFLDAIFPGLLGTTSADTLHLTQIALEMEEHGHRFANCLHRLADEYGLWYHALYPKP